MARRNSGSIAMLEQKDINDFRTGMNSYSAGLVIGLDSSSKMHDALI